jgi:hypothetical protein
LLLVDTAGQLDHFSQPVRRFVARLLGRVEARLPQRPAIGITLRFAAQFQSDGGELRAFHWLTASLWPWARSALTTAMTVPNGVLSP